MSHLAGRTETEPPSINCSMPCWDTKTHLLKERGRREKGRGGDGGNYPTSPVSVFPGKKSETVKKL